MDPEAARLEPPALWPLLLDRAQAQALLASALDRLSAGRGLAVLVVGEAGIGKTALLRAFLARLDPARAAILAARCYEGAAALPFAAWMEVLEAAPDLRVALPGPLGARRPAAQSLAALAHEVASALATLARERPVILAFDDLHLADDSSLALVRAVAQRLDRAPILLLLTFRAPLPALGPVADLVPLLLREAPARYVELRPIGADAIRSLVDARYPARPPDERARFAERLAHLSGGNALFLAELLAAVDEVPAATSTSLESRLARLPATLRQIITHRAAQLSPRALELLRLAALVGEAVDLDLLVELAASDPEETLTCLEEACALGMLVEDDRGRLRFRHGVVRQALVEEQSLPRRRRLHARILAALRGRQDVPPATLALFAEGAGDLLAASDLLVVAARQAEALFAYPEAERLYRRAFLLAEEARAEPARRDELRLAFADSIKRADRETAVREVEAIATRARLRGDALGLARARQRLALFAYEAGQRSAAAAMLDEVIPVLEAAGDLATLGQALVCLGYCRQSASDFPALEAVARRLLALADELGDPEYRAIGLHFIATARVARGEPEQAPELERESVEMLAELARYDLAVAYAAVALVRVDLLANLRRPAMVEKLIRRGEELDREASARLGLAPGQCTAEFCYWWLLRGDWERVRAELPDPRAFAAQAEPQPLKDVVHTIAAELALAEGRSGEAETLLRYIAPAPEAPLGEHSYQQWLFAVERLIGLRLEADDLAGARAWLGALDRALEQRLHVPGELLLEIATARLRLAEGRPDEAERTLAGTIERADRTGNALARAAALRLMAEALARLDRCPDALAAAEQALAEADRCGLVYEAALAKLTRAELALASGRREAGERDLAEATEVLERLGAHAALARVAALRPPRRRVWPAELTEREVEVLRLVAAGASDRQIAERLFLSPRTVGTHLRNMLNKTGAANRVELTTWAHRHGLVDPGSEPGP